MHEERRDESRRGRQECLRHVSPRSLRLTERPYLNAYARPRADTLVGLFEDGNSLNLLYHSSHRHPKSIRNVVPLPFSLSTAMRPLWSLTTDCTIAKPSPVPCVLVV